MNRKKLKIQAKQVLKRNYWRCFAVSFVVTLLIGGTILLRFHETNYGSSDEVFSITHMEGKTNSDIVNEFVHKATDGEIIWKQNAGFVGTIIDNVSRSGSFLFGILNATNQFLFQDRILAGIIIITGVIISILYWIFVASVLEVGRVRFFLENRLYEKTKMGRILLPFRIRKNFSIALVMTYKKIVEILWMFTIIGGFIKHYAYYLVPYLLAENPELSRKEVLTYSSNMMKGYKWNAFWMDVSFIGWDLLGLLTFNLSNLFYSNIYKEASRAEFYMTCRTLALKQKIISSLIVPDLFLAENRMNVAEYPEQKYFLEEHESRKFLRSLNYNRHYSWNSYILLFFAFSMLGWIWEVCLTLFAEGIFVNRGALFGPWLPIYGSGGVLILFLLRKVRNRPFLTFFLTMLICGIVEYGTAFYLETFKHLKWWDYTGYFLNIHGRVCLEGLVFFGIGGLAFIYILAPFLDQFFQKWNSTMKIIICLILVLLIAIDFIYSGRHPNTGVGVTTPLSMVLDS